MCVFGMREKLLEATDWETAERSCVSLATVSHYQRQKQLVKNNQTQTAVFKTTEFLHKSPGGETENRQQAGNSYDTIQEKTHIYAPKHPKQKKHEFILWKIYIYTEERRKRVKPDIYSKTLLNCHQK